MKTSIGTWRITSEIVEEPHFALYVRDALGLEPQLDSAPPPLSTPPQVRTKRLLRGLDRDELADAWVRWWIRASAVRTIDRVFNAENSHIDHPQLGDLVRRLNDKARRSFHAEHLDWEAANFDRADAAAVTVAAEQSAVRLGTAVERLHATLIVIASDVPWQSEPLNGLAWCSRGTLADQQQHVELLTRAFACSDENAGT